MHKFSVRFRGLDHNVQCVTENGEDLFHVLYSLNRSEYVLEMCLEDGMLPKDFGWDGLEKVVREFSYSENHNQFPEEPDEKQIIESLAVECHTRISANDGFFHKDYFIQCIEESMQKLIKMLKDPKGL